MTANVNLQSSKLWQYFEAISAIPRPSKHEKAIIHYLVDFASELKLDYKTDTAGNLLITKPASVNMTNHKPVVLQSHVDMVCEKNADVVHNFFTDPILPYIDGDWVKARGTTLGADDGIGVAAMMAILADNTLEHGPIECLFTVDEETGLTGAFDLAPDFFSGKMLINLDSEDEGELFIGCAGGIDTIASFAYEPVLAWGNYNGYLVSLTGLTGGHSGDDIHKGFGNAIKIMSDFLWESLHRFNIEVHRFEGGNLRNAIPREAFASILVPETSDEEFRFFVDFYREKISTDYSTREPSFSFMADAISMPDTKLSAEFQEKFLEALNQCPNGVIAWSADIDDLVETSTNLASIKFTNGNIIIETSQRSAIDQAKRKLASEVEDVFAMAGAEVSHSDGYPGWTPNPESPLLKITVETYSGLFEIAPKVKAIHAGLECGLFLEKYPGLDMISFGPTIKGVHSPDERLYIPSVDKFWQLLIAVLKKL
ncbi:MAG: aminoacyl-histidine dipeptidase [Bacteroidota bacterium]|nr:aminoacyl-histidine dipeptidase [Bacteroidota bacterium]